MNLGKRRVYENESINYKYICYEVFEVVKT